MSSLREVIIFTPNIDGMREFYEGGVGLSAALAGPNRVTFDTAGTTLALQGFAEAAPRSVLPGASGPQEREFELAFETSALDTAVRACAIAGSRWERSAPMHPAGRPSSATTTATGSRCARAPSPESGTGASARRWRP